MQKLLLIIALTICSSTLLAASATADIDFQNKVQKLEGQVRYWNPISNLLNTTYRLPTKAAYQERLEVAKKVHDTTGKSRLLRETCNVGYQRSWLKKRPILNLVVTVLRNKYAFPLVLAGVRTAIRLI